ncbi:hypothetical protein BV898_15979 [Hypsibius exemplaris]|uniref:CUB domain-containing protein n=1 Tax=Hypsibius exemplaris TaxID=2072580 RepID=A0A9X6RKU4_HYPEX|nr:hypothetical protein BV898_15979 [Hypsibius exemplaris]
MAKGLLSILALLTVCITGLDAVYSTTYVSCGDVVNLSCYNLASSRTSTLQFWSSNFYTSNCRVTIQLGSTLTCPGYTFGIYMNIKRLSLRSTDSAEIREETSGYSQLVKTLPGGSQSGSTSPQSVAQIMSRYAFRPTFVLDLKINSGTSYASSPIVLDVNVLNEYSLSDVSLYCEALLGYEHDSLCGNDHVHCPTSYSITNSLNPAYGIQSCSIGGGAIAGIVLGIFFFVLFVAVVSVLVRRNRQRVIHHHTAPSCGPVIISGGAVNTGYGQPQHYQGPPPQYGPGPYPAGGQAMAQPQPPQQY